MRFQADGYMYKEVDFKFEFSADKMADVSMKDAWVGFKYVPFARIRLGQFKTPFSRQRIISSSKLQIIERSPVQVLYPGRDIGFELSGKNIGGLFDYAAALLSGAGDKRKYLDTDNDYFLTDGRLAFHPLGSIKHSEGDVCDSQDFKFELAGNILYAPRQLAFGEKAAFGKSETKSMFGDLTYYAVSDNNGDGSVDLADFPEGDTVNLGPELTMVFRGFSLVAEAYWAQFNPDSTEEWKINNNRRTVKSMGCFVQGGAFVISKTLELTGRFDYLDIDTDKDSSRDLQAYTGGLNFFPFHDHKYKLQANFIREFRRGKYDKDNNTVMVNAQIKY